MVKIMENNYIILSLNLFEVVFITVILVYTFWFSEKKYFNILILSVINKLLVLLGKAVRYKKMEDK